MKKTHPKSQIVQFHHYSKFAEELLGPHDNKEYVVLQLEAIDHKEHDFIAEIIKKEEYERRL